MRRKANLRVERRARTRYAIQCTLRFTLHIGAAPARSGEGVSVNISSSGILFRSDIRVSAGDYIVVCLDWPSHPEGGSPMQLLLAGYVIWSKGGMIAASISRYDFVSDGQAETSPEAMPRRYVIATRPAVSTRGRVLAARRGSNIPIDAPQEDSEEPEE